jgi:hypothetical protein
MLLQFIMKTRMRIDLSKCKVSAKMLHYVLHVGGSPQTWMLPKAMTAEMHTSWMFYGYQSAANLS